MIFDPILLFGLDMGVEGIALATVLGQILSALLAVRYLARRRRWSTPAGGFPPAAPAVKSILALGGPIFCNHVLMTASQILLMNIFAYLWGPVGLWRRDHHRRRRGGGEGEHCPAQLHHRHRFGLPTHPRV